MRSLYEYFWVVRRWVSILILFLMLWQIVGFVGYFEFSHYKVKKEIKKRLKEGVPSEELVHFSFTEEELNELKWLKPHEFELNGSLFDVVRKKQANRIYYLECISDKQETVLFANLERMVNTDLNDHSENPGLAYWFKILASPSLPVTGQLNTFNNLEVTRQKHHYNYHFSIILSFVDTLIQPPMA